MASQPKQITENKAVNWSAGLRPKVGATVKHNGIYWSNVNGRNIEPGTDGSWEKMIIEQIDTGWQSALLPDTQILVKDAPSIINLVGAQFDSNGISGILNSNGTITPSGLNDFIILDVAFQFVTPSATGGRVEVFIEVEGVKYRSFLHPMLKDTAVVDIVSASFGLPVQQDFFENGASIKVVSDLSITISNKYVSVGQIYKGI